MNLFDVFPELEPYYDRNRKVDPVYQQKYSQNLIMNGIELRTV